jgi:uncharacterized tellurite resistance protein B-like protein|tara:strand:- start:125 stop:538 length:414 start_codon:yes stop_codon:yes gene_type:complete
MFFKSSENKEKKYDFEKVAALLIHAAKIDENFSNEEEKIIYQTLLKIGANNEKIDKIIQIGKEIEENSNQILDFTKEVKNMSDENKIKIIEALWSIIYSNKKADIFETNLMRRLAGLLYVDNKTMGLIKERIKNKKS